MQLDGSLSDTGLTVSDNVCLSVRTNKKRNQFEANHTNMCHFPTRRRSDKQLCHHSLLITRFNILSCADDKREKASALWGT